MKMHIDWYRVLLSGLVVAGFSACSCTPPDDVDAGATPDASATTDRGAFDRVAPTDRNPGTDRQTATDLGPRIDSAVRTDQLRPADSAGADNAVATDAAAVADARVEDGAARDATVEDATVECQPGRYGPDCLPCTCPGLNCNDGASGDGSCEPATSCRTVANRRGDGVYTIDPDGDESNPPFEVYCDMTTDGGGWTLITSIDSAATMAAVDHTTLITPASSNVTNRGMRLPDVSEILLVTDGRDEGFETSYDKAEKISGVTDHALTWQQIIDALNLASGDSWSDIDYSAGVDEAWQFAAERVNSEGCLQVALRGTYGDGNYGGFNGAFCTPIGVLWYHWGNEIWVSGIFDCSDTPLGDLRCNTDTRFFASFWQGVYLR